VTGRPRLTKPIEGYSCNPGPDGARLMGDRGHGAESVSWRTLSRSLGNAMVAILGGVAAEDD
jgi:hypothetical protein